MYNGKKTVYGYTSRYNSSSSYTSYSKYSGLSSPTGGPTGNTESATKDSKSLSQVYESSLGEAYGEGNYCDDFVVKGLKGLDDATTLGKMYGQNENTDTQTVNDVVSRLVNNKENLMSGTSAGSTLRAGDKAVFFFDGEQDGRFDHMGMVEKRYDNTYAVYHSGGSSNQSQVTVYNSLDSLQRTWNGNFQYMQTTK